MAWVWFLYPFERCSRSRSFLDVPYVCVWDGRCRWWSASWTNRRQIALRKNYALASRRELELRVTLSWSSLIFISFARSCVRHDAAWVSSEVLPSFACFLTEAALLPAPKWGVSVGGVSRFHFLAGWRLSYSCLLSQRGGEGVRGSRTRLSLLLTQSTSQGLSGREGSEWAEQNLQKGKWASRILQICGAGRTEKLSCSRTWGKWAGPLFQAFIGWTLTPHPYANAHLDERFSLALLLSDTPIFYPFHFAHLCLWGPNSIVKVWITFPHVKTSRWRKWDKKIKCWTFFEILGTELGCSRGCCWVSLLLIWSMNKCAIKSAELQATDSKRAALLVR